MYFYLCTAISSGNASSHALELDVNYHLSITLLFSCVNYILLNTRYVSVIKEHLKGVCHAIREIYNSYVFSKVIGQVVPVLNLLCTSM
jgi:hypothetical protein